MLLTALVATFIAIQSQSVPTGPFLRYSDLDGKPYTVASDGRSWIINGKRSILLGGSVHYPRLSPGQWKPILSKMLQDGLNHAEVYIFWNIHEPLYDFSGTHVYNYEGRANLSLFLETAKAVGIFVNLRIGPYVCAEWSFGGLPTWLLHVADIRFRDSDQPWENEMQTFIEEIKRVSEPYLAKNGGPVILAQIENEYHGSGQNATDYVTWCGELTKQLDMGVSWVMCNGASANDTINTCNGNDCYSKFLQGHTQQHPNQPLGWTENEGWFQSWTGSYNASESSGNNRSPENMAYVVAMWFAGGAAHHNYYMWYGGNHVSWTAGSGITNFYANGVNLYGDGLANEPKKTHLMRLHNIISEYGEYPLMESSIQINNKLNLSNVNGTYSLSIAPCDSNNKGQQWSFNATTGLLRASAFGNSKCVYSTGKSNPVNTQACNTNNKHQKWIYNSNQEFQSSDNSCLDVYAAKGPNIDEYSCKDSKNQQWTINANRIISAQNQQCLTAAPGNLLFAFQYHSTTQNKNLTFICNTDSQNASGVWNGKRYELVAQSVIILDNNNNILYNTAIVNSTGLATKRIYSTIYNGTNSNDLSYSSWTEILPLTSNPQHRPDTPAMNKTPLEQIRFTNDTYEYLFYSTEFTAAAAMVNPRVNITGRKANAYVIYIDNKMMAQTWDGSHSMADVNFSMLINGTIASGTHTLTVISSSLGIHNGIANQQAADAQDKKGIVGQVVIGNMNVTQNNWNHWIGRTGEVLHVAGSGMNKVEWKSPVVVSNGFTWYKVEFATPSQVSNTNGVILVDIGANGMGFKRGHWFLNAMDMGHYNNVIGKNNLMVQQYYFIPSDYLTPNKGQNVLVFAEELDQIDPMNSNIVYSTFVVP